MFDDLDLATRSRRARPLLFFPAKAVAVYGLRYVLYNLWLLPDGRLDAWIFRGGGHEAGGRDELFPRGAVRRRVRRCGAGPRRAHGRGVGGRAFCFGPHDTEADRVGRSETVLRMSVADECVAKGAARRHGVGARNGVLDGPSTAVPGAA